MVKQFANEQEPFRQRAKALGIVAALQFEGRNPLARRLIASIGLIPALYNALIHSALTGSSPCFLALSALFRFVGIVCSLLK